ncbi:T9SS type B sorting domain-containing protein [Galbibacter sp. BG1]|uniref:T9SS type B sorting domain-containing protein n=1 Tax=Galbibacter sp. BG1 TaxID=1170699 RepID=UPI0015BCDB7C|nr:T9SS type B sorting domain-containing protein [Galbibacter sp. BG1]QLE02132.1 T9SS type B sorting domain-containing protein [Galbibacter sp. BG1]
MLTNYKFSFLIFFLFACHTLFYGQTNNLPNDCVNAITVCGSSKISSNADGIGIQELGTNNTCSSFEHNSLWLKINIVKAGTLGFTLKPTKTDLEVDYDFFIYGPTATCTNLGASIRCSTTNPIAAGQTSNLTGMNDTETDTSEGPGELGNGYVRSLDVAVGDSYFIVIDRPIGDGGFDIEWTGTAVTGGSPFPPAPVANTVADITLCNDSGSNTFDLYSLSAQINSNANNSIAFFETLMDANDNTNPITAPVTLTDASKEIHARVTNVNGCFDLTSFNIAAYKNPEALNTTLVQCDLDLGNSTDGITTFNLNQADLQITNNNTNNRVIYFSSANNRTNNNPISDPERFVGSNNQTIYARVINSNNCTKDAELLLKVNSTTASLTQSGPYFSCDRDENDLIVDGTFNLREIKENAYPNLDVSLFYTREDASLELNEITAEEIISENSVIYVRIEDNNECQDIEEFNLVVDEKPKIILPDPLPLLCLNNPTLTLTANAGFDSYKWVYVADDGTEKVVSTNENTPIAQTGNYFLEASRVYNSFGVTRTCTSVKNFEILPSNIATLNPEPLVEDISENNRITVFVEGDGDYEFSIGDISGPYQDGNIFENVSDGFTEIFVRDKNGCGIVSKTISIIGYDKFFTPNGDAINDYWQIAGINAFTQANSLIYIFDRYGKLVKQLDPTSKGWDGTYNGIDLPASDYWFRVKLEDGRDFKGHFSLKR